MRVNARVNFLLGPSPFIMMVYPSGKLRVLKKGRKRPELSHSTFPPQAFLLHFW